MKRQKKILSLKFVIFRTKKLLKFNRGPNSGEIHVRDGPHFVRVVLYLANPYLDGLIFN